MSYLGNSPGVASQRVESAFTATSAQTVFTPSSGYTLGYCDVYQNGVKLVNGDDYTAADGATVTLATGAASGDSIVIVASFPRGLSDGYLKSEADAKYLTIANPSYTGTLTGGTGVVNLGSGQFYKDASGNVGVGTTVPVTKFAIENTERLEFAGASGFVYSQALNAARNATVEQRTYGSALSWWTGAAGGQLERMRIDGSGNLLVGLTSAFLAGTVSNTAQFVSGSQGFQVVTRCANAASGKYWHQGADNNNNHVVYNQGNTGVYITDGGTSWSANSDERLKTALIPFENAAEKVCSLRAGTGRYLTDDESVSRSFLIAQDVQAVLPEAVNVQSDEIGTLGLAYADTIPLLVAAIKEQQAIIEQLQADVATLKGTP